MNLEGFLEDPEAQADVRRRTLDIMGAASDPQFWGDVVRTPRNVIADLLRRYGEEEPQPQAYVQGYGKGGAVKAATEGGMDLLRRAYEKGVTFRPKPQPTVQTVRDPNLYAANVYDRDVIRTGVRDAAESVPEENPLLAQLLGTSRGELAALADQPGNFTGTPWRATRGMGSVSGNNAATVRNANRIKGLIEETRSYPSLYEGMKGWYSMEPMHRYLRQNYGDEEAARLFDRFNAMTSLSSPNSNVITELNRGTGANWLAEQGRFDDFQTYVGKPPAVRRQMGAPEDLMGIKGHMGHTTSMLPGMRKYLERDLIGAPLDTDEAKVASYYLASNVPSVGVGRQTQYPVGDAHWARIVGLPDTRNLTSTIKKDKYGNVIDKYMGPDMSNASSAEMNVLAPWWRKLSADMGLESVPAQAITWGGGSRMTGVDSAVGVPKLELFLGEVEKAARRMNTDPATAMDLILRGKAYAG